MMGPQQVAQGALFYKFSIEEHVPDDHLVRLIDRFVDLSDIRRFLAPFYSSTGRPRALTEKDLAAAKAMLRDPEITVEDVARQLGVGSAAHYRHIPGGRSAVMESSK